MSTLSTQEVKDPVTATATASWPFAPLSDDVLSSQPIGLTAKERLDELGSRLEELRGKQIKFAEKLPQVVEICKDALEIGNELATDEKKNALQSEIAASKKGHRVIYSVASQITDVVEKFLSGLSSPAAESKDAPEDAVIDSKGLDQAKEAIGALKQFLEQHPPVMSASVEKAEKEPKLPVPHVHPDAVALLKNYESLLEGLSGLMKGALDPNVQTPPAVLNDELAKLKEQFENLTKKCVLGDKFDDLVRPVFRKLHQIEEQVKEYEGKPISEASVKDISIFTGKTEADVLKDIEAGKTLNAERKERHDALAKVWSDVLIQKAAIEWELQRIAVFAGIHAEVESLNNQLSMLEGQIEATKDKLKIEVPKLKAKQTELDKLLAATKPVLETYYKEYNKIADSAKATKAKADETLSALAKQKEEAGKALLQALGEIHLYDEAKRKEIDASSEKALGIIQDEREELYTNFDVVWKNVYKKLDFADAKISLTYELVRLCYAVEKNNGALPTDTFYKARLLGWYPEREPVKSPWTQEPVQQVSEAAASSSSGAGESSEIPVDQQSDSEKAQSSEQ